MSITFQLEHHFQTSEEIYSFECLCIDDEDSSQPAKDCLDCEGTGRVVVKGDPYSVSFHNSGGLHLQDTLFGESDYSGEKDAHEFHAALIQEGRFLEIRKYTQLFSLCLQAKNKGSKIVWS